MISSGLRVLERLPAAELVKDLFLRFFADRAGVEQDDVRILLTVRGHQAVALDEQVAHARGVVLVHLAAVGFDVDLFHAPVGGCRGALVARENQGARV
jgi:hypothetical protein